MAGNNVCFFKFPVNVVVCRRDDIKPGHVVAPAILRTDHYCETLNLKPFLCQKLHANSGDKAAANDTLNRK